MEFLIPAFYEKTSQQSDPFRHRYPFLRRTPVVKGAACHRLRLALDNRRAAQHPEPLSEWVAPGTRATFYPGNPVIKEWARKLAESSGQRNLFRVFETIETVMRSLGDNQRPVLSEE
ncbi:MAG: hypothetical protein ACRER2_10680 [Methylococcales bacterium]